MKKLVAVAREAQEDYRRNGKSRNTSVPRFDEDFINQVSKKIEGRFTKKLSQEFNRTENCLLGALNWMNFSGTHK